MVEDQLDYWDTTVGELVVLFRSALKALIPTLERARIPWRDGEAYDQWDEIGSVLYSRLVVEPLTCALKIAATPGVAAYDVFRQDWRDISFVAVRHPDLQHEKVAAFLYLASNDDPLDTVVVNLLDESLDPGPRFQSLEFAETEFVLMHCSGDDLLEVSSVSVPD